MLLSRHARVELLIVAGLALGSCDYHSPIEAYELAEVANVNARNALAKIDALESRLDELESKLNLQNE